MRRVFSAEAVLIASELALVFAVEPVVGCGLERVRRVRQPRRPTRELGLHPREQGDSSLYRSTPPTWMQYSAITRRSAELPRCSLNTSAGDTSCLRSPRKCSATASSLYESKRWSRWTTCAASRTGGCTSQRERGRCTGASLARRRTEPPGKTWRRTSTRHREAPCVAGNPSWRPPRKVWVARGRGARDEPLSLRAPSLPS